MSFINGFFLINFLPLGILVIVGFVFFFSGKFKIEKWRHPLLFIFLVLAAVSAWRIPIIYDRRYAMPALVPSIVISVFALMLLPEILKRFKVPYDKAITRTAIAILLIACVAKAMRVQENKEYLHDIAEAVKLDCKENNIKGHVALLVFGNPGGHLVFDNNVKVTSVDNKPWNNRLANVEYQFRQLDRDGLNHPDVLKCQYQHLYLLCVERVSGSFQAAWEKQYIDKPELIFKHISKKQIAYRLYRVKSASKVAWLHSDEFERMLANKDDLFKNEDFKKKYCISHEDDTAKILRNRGIDLFGNGEVSLPAGWTLNQYKGWTIDCNPVSIKFTEEDTKALNVQSKAMISIYSEDMLDADKTYLIAVRANSKTRGCLGLSAYTYTEQSKYIQEINLKEIELSNKNNRYLIYFKMRNCGKIKLILTFSENVTISNIKTVSADIETHN
jgi:hypothetical protein